MRKSLPLSLCILGLLLIFSCKKSNSGNGGGNSAADTSYLSTVVSSESQQRIVDSFHYDVAHRIDTFTQSVYDTAGGYTQFNNITVEFVYQGANTYPSWYYQYDVTLGNYGDYHLLSYDPQGRITKDTSLSGSGYVSYFSYPNNNIATTTLFEGTPDDNFIDTFYISNGNIGVETVYTPENPGQPDVQQGNVKISYTLVSNPTWHPDITNSIGPLLENITILNNGGFVDFLSKNVLSNETGTESSYPPTVNISFLSTKDDKGRLAMLGSPAGAAAGQIVFSYY